MDELVQQLIADGILRTPTIIDAFLAVDRKNFVRTETMAHAYGDYPLPIGFGQTISQPTTVAFMLELLQPRRGETILDVGSGSGWTTALLGSLVGPLGRVYGVEVIPELVRFGQENLNRVGIFNATIEHAGEQLGKPSAAPPSASGSVPPTEGFDRILVSAAATELPRALVDQLKPGGTMVLPIASAVCRVTKDKRSHYKVQKFEGFAFVPLVEEGKNGG